MFRNESNTQACNFAVKSEKAKAVMWIISLKPQKWIGTTMKSMYSWVPNISVGGNKHVGEKIMQILIKVQVGIIM